MADDAPAHENDWLQPTVDTVTYSDGASDEVYGFDIPVAAVDADFQLAILGTKGTWYDHTVSISDAEPAAEDAAAAAVEIPADGSYTSAVPLEGGSGRAAGALGLCVSRLFHGTVADSQTGLIQQQLQLEDLTVHVLADLVVAESLEIAADDLVAGGLAAGFVVQIGRASCRE